MGNVDQGDILRVVANMTLNRDQECKNVYYFRNEGLGAATDSQAQADIAAFLDDFYGTFNAGLSDQLTYIDIGFFNVTQNRPMTSALWPTLVAGTNSAQQLPAGAAALVGLNTGVVRIRGRKYIGGFTEGTNDGDVVGSSTLSGLASAAATLLGSFLGASLHAWLPGVVAQNGDFWGFIEAVASGVWAYQRRRRFGTGD